MTTVEYLKDFLLKDYSGPYFNSSHYDEVFPGIFLGDMETAKNVTQLEKLRITHVLNAADCISPFSSPDNEMTSELYYSQRNFQCTFLGIPAQDLATFKLSDYFDEATNFIQSGLESNGKVFVHCELGVSRSATLVLAYLMMKQKMNASQAVQLVKDKREVLPNDGFLQQIADLDYRLKHPSITETTKFLVQNHHG